MPNWTYNRMSMSKKTFAEFKEKYIDDNGDFDFNKVLPMPEELKDTIAGGIIEECIAYHLYNTMTRMRAEDEIKRLALHLYVEKRSLLSTQEVKDALLERIGNNPRMYATEFDNPSKESHTPEEIGKHYYDLYNKFGCCDWYQWANKYWGTKWNANDTKINENTKSVSSITFDTAWCHPYGVYEQIARDNPNWSINVHASYEGGETPLRAKIKDGLFIEG